MPGKVLKMATQTVAGLAHELDQEGCAYGQVSRERLSHIQAAVERVADEVQRVETKLNYVLAAIGLQLFGFVLGVIVFLLYHTGGKWMALTPLKVAHIIANRAIFRAGRTTPVAIVYRTAYGGHTAVSANIILKGQGSSVPATLDTAGMVVNEYLAEFDLTIDPSMVAYVALTPNGAVDDAEYRRGVAVGGAELSALRPGHDRYQVGLRRLR